MVNDMDTVQRRLLFILGGIFMSMILSCLAVAIYEEALGWHGNELMAFVTIIPGGTFLSVLLSPLIRAPQTCPYCKERIKADATVCKHCGRELG